MRLQAVKTILYDTKNRCSRTVASTQEAVKTFFMTALWERTAALLQVPKRWSRPSCSKTRELLLRICLSGHDTVSPSGVDELFWALCT